MLKIAIQKSGRLSDGSLELLKDCNVKLSRGKGTLVTPAHNFPAEVLFLRDDDIPQYVEDGVADIGIIGENVLLESANGVDVVKRLGFSKCRMSLAVPKNDQYDGLAFFSDKRIATSYPKILQNYLNEHNLVADIHSISGSVEIAPGIGLADAVMDIVSTGSTLLSNGLKEVETVLKSEAILISNRNLAVEKKEILDRLIFRIDAVLRARGFKYVLLNAPNENVGEIIKILPGMKSPTVLPLAEEGWSSIHSVLDEARFWDMIDQLRELGAEGILIVPIEKMIV